MADLKWKLEEEKIPATHIIGVIDRSGSMGGQEREVVSSFNNFIKEQQKLDIPAFVSLILFDYEFISKYTHKNIRDIRNLTLDDYIPRGSTALFDAIDLAISEYACKDKSEKTIIVIITDGAENASRRVRTAADIKKEISAARENGIEFVFLAADEVSFAQGAIMGIPSGNSFNYKTVGYSGGSTVMSASMSRFRGNAAYLTDSFITEDNKDKRTVATK